MLLVVVFAVCSKSWHCIASSTAISFLPVTSLSRTLRPQSLHPDEEATRQHGHWICCNAAGISNHIYRVNETATAVELTVRNNTRPSHLCVLGHSFGTGRAVFVTQVELAGA